MARRLTYDFVKKSFEKEGYTLLSKKYKNAHTKLKIRCNNGHKYYVTWSNWKSGYRCPHCAGNVCPTITYISKLMTSEGYTFLSGKYINQKSKLKCICDNGHIYFTSWAAWRMGSRCPHCSRNAPITINEVKESFEAEGYILLSDKYVNSTSKLVYICNNGHTHSISWASWRSGSRCPYCAKRPPININYIKIVVEKEGYTLLSTYYKNCDTKLNFICNYGHSCVLTWAHWKSGSRCSVCANTKTALRQIGKTNSNWKGGISKEPYCNNWDDDLKSYIKDRDGNRCLNPYCYKTDKILVVHHIDYNKKNCRPNNLITVCRACNGRANTDRNWHKAWYQAILKRRYNYEY